MDTSRLSFVLLDQFQLGDPVGHTKYVPSSESELVWIKERVQFVTIGVGSLFLGAEGKSAADYRSVLRFVLDGVGYFVDLSTVREDMRAARIAQVTDENT